MKNAIETTHKLYFCVCEWSPVIDIDMLCSMLGIPEDKPYPDIDWVMFQVGTCNGQWRATPDAYEILSIINEDPGNGHLIDVLEWFEFACKLSKKPLRFLAFENLRFKQHLMEKRGFTEKGEDVEKDWRAMG